MPDSVSMKGVNQTGLARLLKNIKANFAQIAHTHTRSDITDFPTIPTKTSDLTNDSGFVTENDVPTVSVTGVKGGAELDYRTGNINLTAGNIGALSTSGGNLSGPTAVERAHIDGQNILNVKSTDNDYSVGLHIGTGGVNHGVYDFYPLNKWLIYATDSKIYAGAVNVTTTAEARTSIGAAASSHNHSASEITSGTLADARIPSLAASKINSGTFSADRIPSLDASKIASGSFSWDRVPKSYQHSLGVVDLWYGNSSGAAITAGTTISNSITSQIGVHFQYVMILYRTYAGSGDYYLQIIPFESAGNGYERYGCGYGMGIHATSAGTHYSRGGMGYVYWNPSNGYFEWNVGTGYKGTSADTKALVPVIIRGGIIY